MKLKPGYAGIVLVALGAAGFIVPWLRQSRHVREKPISPVWAHVSGQLQCPAGGSVAGVQLSLHMPALPWDVSFRPQDLQLSADGDFSVQFMVPAAIQPGGSPTLALYATAAGAKGESGSTSPCSPRQDWTWELPVLALHPNQVANNTSSQMAAKPMNGPPGMRPPQIDLSPGQGGAKPGTGSPTQPGQAGALPNQGVAGPGTGQPLAPPMLGPAPISEERMQELKRLMVLQQEQMQKAGVKMGLKPDDPRLKIRIPQEWQR